MGFYDLPKEQRAQKAKAIEEDIRAELQRNQNENILLYFSDEDTYIRKAGYLGTGRIYFRYPSLQKALIESLLLLSDHTDFRVRQTVINAAGEVGKVYFEKVRSFFDNGLFDPHHSPRNAVVGSIKKMGEVNPVPVLAWAREYLHHPDKEIRREICHGIELRGRKYPQDILPLLKELEHDRTARVRNTLVHVLGQIAYKRGCLQTVLDHLNGWENHQLIADALEEIIDVHHRYRDFAVLTHEEAKRVIKDFGF